jgi:hypothetical protein
MEGRPLHHQRGRVTVKAVTIAAPVRAACRSSGRSHSCPCTSIGGPTLEGGGRERGRHPRSHRDLAGRESGLRLAAHHFHGRDSGLPLLRVIDMKSGGFHISLEVDFQGFPASDAERTYGVDRLIDPRL